MLARLLPIPTLLLAAVLPAAGGCSDDSATEPTAPPCTVDGPIGLAPGEVVPNVELMACDGSVVDLRQLCSKTASFVYAFAPW